MSLTLRQRPIYVLSFLLVLVVPQVLGLGKQFDLGFKPFITDPKRVPLSWDMFSNPVDRCTVTWTSPLQLGDHRISSLREVELPLEWDIVLDKIEQYRMMARALCPYSTEHPNSVQLQCYSSGGAETKNEFTCD